MADEIDRLDAVESLIKGIRETYSDTKKIDIGVSFQWQETFQTDIDNALCPIVSVKVER